MKTPIALILALALSCSLLGCAPKKVSPYTAGTAQGIVLSTQQINAALWNLAQAAKAGAGAAGKAYLAAAVYALETAKEGNNAAYAANEEVAKKVGRLEKAYDDLRRSCKWIGWQTRHYWHWIVGIYLGTGVLSVVAGLSGFMGFSKLLNTNIFKPFVWIRDLILKRRNGGVSTTTVVVLQASAPPPTVSVQSPAGATPVQVETRGTA